jgi:small subunit ribosomal protein S17
MSGKKKGAPVAKKGPAKGVSKKAKAAAKMAQEATTKSPSATPVVASEKTETPTREVAKKAAPVAKPATTEGAAATADQAAATRTHSFRRRLIGTVTSDKMTKTVVVEVTKFSLDRVYKKYVKRQRKYKAHDENNEFRTGDRVEIQEFRPISREKRFRVVRLVSRPVVE